jgi:hypothetical protein
VSGASEPPPPDRADEPDRPAGRGRRIAARVLTVIGVLLAVVSVAAGYVRWQLLDTDTFSNTAGELIENDAVRDQVALKLVDELYTNVDVTASLEERLPANMQALAGPLAGASRQLAETGAERLLERPRIQSLWKSSVTLAHEQLINVLEGGGPVVSTEGGAVVLNLRPLVVQLGDQVAIVGRVAERLPEDAGRVEILEADQLETAQTITQWLKVAGTWLWIVTLAVFALAIWLARGYRRRELRAIALGVFLVALLLLLVRRLAGSYLVDELAQTESARTAGDAAWDILRDRLKGAGWTLLLLAVAGLVGVWFVGRGRRATALRGALAPYLRRPEIAYGAYAAFLLLLFAFTPFLGWWRWTLTLVIVALGAIGVEAVRRHTAREFPDAVATDVWASLTGKLTSLREGEPAPAAAAQPRAGAPGAPEPVALEAQLERLGALRTQGVLTEEEFVSAKAKVLA